MPHTDCDLGGNSLNSLYSWTAPLPMLVLTYIGCYNDNQRPLPAILATTYTAMTVETCAYLAYARGYNYFGLQNGQGMQPAHRHR